MKNAGLGGWLLAMGLALAGCETAELGPTVSMPPDQAADVAEVSKAKAPEVDPELVAIYAARRDGDLVLPAVDVGAFHRCCRPSMTTPSWSERFPTQASAV
jgi:hypothetical protein